jgi:CheY-like chemotaxis protein
MTDKKPKILCVDDEPKNLELLEALLVPRGGLPNIYAKLKEGKEVRIGYFGGSTVGENNRFGHGGGQGFG